VFTLRDYLAAHSWLAMTAGHTVGSALMQLRDDGVPIDCPAWFTNWRSTRSDRDLWSDLRQRLKGRDEHDPTVARFRNTNRERRVLSRFRADHASVQEIAAEESLPVKEVERIVRAEVKAQRERRVQHKRAVAELDQQKAERLARFHDAYRLAGRRPPQNLEHMIKS
jgi:hypothetical protein